MKKPQWTTLPSPDFRDLSEARRQSHQALQLVSAFARSAQPDDPSDTLANLRWWPEHQALVSRPSGDWYRIRLGLRLTDLSLLALSPYGELLGQYPLDGRTFEEGWTWVQLRAEEWDIDHGDFSLKLPYDIPEYPWASSDTPFSVRHSLAYEALATWFDNSHHLFHDYAQVAKLHNPIATWPHHYDMGTGRREMKGTESFLIGIGSSPGEPDFDQPYYYLMRYPNEGVQRENLPDAPAGAAWVTEDWLGLRLPCEVILRDGDAEAQRARVVQFLNEGPSLLYSLEMEKEGEKA